MKIILDAMGGDHAPEAPVLGAIDAAKTFGTQITLVGRGEAILEVMKKHGIETLPEGMEDTPILTVKARSLELTAASETRVDDGTPLTNSTVYITKGTLAPGHTLTAAAEGIQTGAGTSENTVGDVTILDQNGKDVTSLYTIRKIKGTLTLLAEA